MRAGGTSTHERLPALDGLRGIAILLVAWFHIWQITWLTPVIPVTAVSLEAIPWTGFTGVYLFFFISGFCLFDPYAQERFGGKPVASIVQFAYRRAIKIVPSYYLAVAGVIALGWTQFASAGDAARQIGTHLLFVHTWFPDTYGSIAGVMWSLGVEVQFYVLFPAIARWMQRAPLPAFVGAFLVSQSYRIAVVATNHYDPGRFINNLPAVLDIFAAGMLAAYAFRYVGARRPALAARSWWWTGLAIAGVALFWFASNDMYAVRYTMPEWPNPWVAQRQGLFDAAFFTATLGSLLAVRPWRALLGNRVLVFVSTISYNMYLWHQEIARALLGAHLPAWRGADQHLDPAWQFAFTLTAFSAAIAVATLITYAVERPLLRLRPAAIFPRRRAGIESSEDTASAHGPSKEWAAE